MSSRNWPRVAAKLWVVLQLCREPVISSEQGSLFGTTPKASSGIPSSPKEGPTAP